MNLKNIGTMLLVGVYAIVHLQAQSPDTVAVDTTSIPSPEHRTYSTRSTLLADSLVAYAFTFKGKSYRRGGTTAKGFDCSGFTMMIYQHFGVKLPHTSSGQSLMGIAVSVPQARKGDLIFFRGRNATSKRIGHVGIIISNKGEPIVFIHSSSGDGVRIDKLSAPYYKKRFVKVVRVIQ